MGQLVTLTSITANTPAEIYYCGPTSGDCVYVATISVVPFTFVVPDPVDNTTYLIKIIDANGCVDGGHNTGWNFSSAAIYTLTTAPASFI